MAVAAYRQVLRNLRRSNGAASTEESAAALLQAKQRVMLRLKAVRAKRAQRDPRRAFQRLYDNLSALRIAKDIARRNLMTGLAADRRTSSLRSVYGSFKQHGLRAMSSTRLSNPITSHETQECSHPEGSSGTQLPRLEEAAVTGQDGLVRTIVLGVVSSASKIFMNVLSTMVVENGGVLEAALQRPVGRPLITVSNHVAAMDDPLLLAALTPLSSAIQPGAMRWSLCATDRCFKNGLMAAFFRAGQVLPVERGRGMQQPGMRAAQARLAAGEWVHIFPEGTRSGDGETMGSIKAGIGRLIASCQEANPIVVPIMHHGMQHVMPRGCKLPVPGHTVQVLIGEPIAVADILLLAQQDDWSNSRLDKALATRVAESMTALKAQLDGKQPQAPGTQEDLPLALLEDELDAAGHPWTSPFLERFVDTAGAGCGASALTSVSRSFHRSGAEASALLPVDLVAQRQEPFRYRDRLPQTPLFSALHALGIWDVLRGIESTIQGVGGESEGYSHLRSSIMKTML